MEVIYKNDLKILKASAGKKIRSIDDIYIESYIDEEGNEVLEHLPYYSEQIFLAKNFDEKNIDKFYVEE